MKTLLLLRHAKSSWDDPDWDDHERPLNRRGQRDAPRIGRWIAANDLLPSLIVSSTANRAATTMRFVIEASNFAGQQITTDDLYHASPSAIASLLNQVEDQHDRLLVIGHNPGLEEFIEMLTGVDEVMPTAALAVIELSIDRWQDLTLSTAGQLRDLWRPKEMPSE